MSDTSHTGPTPELVAAALASIRGGDVGSLTRLLDASPELVHVDVGAGGSLLGAVAQPDVFGTALGHELGVDRACVELLIARGRVSRTAGRTDRRRVPAPPQPG
jgi:hypothetical protein